MTVRKRSLGPMARRLSGQEPPRGDVYAPACPSRAVLEHVTSRWGVLVLVALLQGGTHRFSELRRKVSGVSEKMLAQTLQALEADGFVHREVFPEIPPRVEYRLTSLGEEVARRVEQLADWIEENLGRILAARTEHSRSSAKPPSSRSPRP